MSNARNRVRTFGNDLRELASRIEARSRYQKSVKDRLFDRLGYERDTEIVKGRSFDSSGRTPIQRGQYGDQDMEI